MIESELDLRDTGHAGAFLRKDGVRVFVDLATDLSGNFGWYWSEQLGRGRSDCDQIVITPGRSGMGPFKTCREACHAALDATGV